MFVYYLYLQVYKNTFQNGDNARVGSKYTFADQIQIYCFSRFQFKYNVLDTNTLPFFIQIDCHF